MLTFYKKASLFFLIPAVVLAVTELLIRNIPNEYRFKFNTLTHPDTTTEVLVCGNSFTYFGINPAWMSKNVFNASQINEPPYINFSKFKKALPNYSRLTTVIVPISFANLRFSKYPDAKLNLLKNYVIYTDFIKPTSLYQYAEVCSDNFKLNSEKIIDFYVHKKNNLYCNEYGWGNFYRTKESKDLAQTSIIRYKTSLTRIETGNSENAFAMNKQLLNEWAAMCAERKINLLFIYMPVSSYMYRTINKAMLNETNTFMNQFVRNNPHCTYYNLIQIPQLSDVDFYDADHLNTQGAKKMTAVVDSLLKTNSTKAN